MDEQAIPTATTTADSAGAAVDLNWVWREVRKRIFIKVAFEPGIAEAMETVVPIVFDNDHFVVGLPRGKFQLSQNLNPEVVGTIESILRSAAGRNIKFEVIDGLTAKDWEHVLEMRNRAHDAVVALASSEPTEHQIEDILSQVVGEIRRRISAIHDKQLPQVKARIVLDIAPSLSDAEEMLFPDPESRDAKRAMGRVIDRVAGFMEVPPVTLAIEIERYRREHRVSPTK